MTRAKIGIVVEGQNFNSLKDAAKYLNLREGGLSYALNHSKNREYNGLKIAFADETKENNFFTKANKKSRRTYYNCTKSCPVICETTKKRFKTISAAARYAKANKWTMSKKMETAGQFRDEQNRIYKRLKAMNTKNQYKNTGDALAYEHPCSKRIVSGPETIIPKVELSGIQLAKQILKDKAIAFVEKDNFTMAKELMGVIEQIKA